MNLSIKFTVQCEGGWPNGNGGANTERSGLQLIDDNKKPERLKYILNF